MKAILLAAGQGERLVPLTETRPKHMIPIAGEPILSHVLKAVRGAGIGEAIVVVGYLMGSIRSHFGDGGRWGVKLEYAEQREPLGTGDALRAIPWKSYPYPLLVLYGDLLLSARAIASVLGKHRESGGTILGAVRVRDPRPYGVLKVKGDEVMDLVEKPGSVSDGLVNAGIYAFGEEISSAISVVKRSPRGELELTDAIKAMIRKGSSVKFAEIPQDSWMDIGRPWDILSANENLLKKIGPSIKGVVEDGARINGPMVLGEGSRILSGAYIEGPCLIGNDTVIGPNCYIRPFTSIGNGVRIGNGCEVKDSIILDRTHIGHLSYVGDSIVGEGCNFGAGTKIANLRFDDAPVKVRVKRELVDSGRRKLGAFIGDEVRTGINSSIMPGVKISHQAWIGPNVVVYDDVKPRSFVCLDQRVKRVRR